MIYMIRHLKYCTFCLRRIREGLPFFKACVKIPNKNPQYNKQRSKSVHNLIYTHLSPIKTQRLHVAILSIAIFNL